VWYPIRDHGAVRSMATVRASFGARRKKKKQAWCHKRGKGTGVPRGKAKPTTGKAKTAKGRAQIEPSQPSVQSWCGSRKREGAGGDTI